MKFLKRILVIACACAVAILPTNDVCAMKRKNTKEKASSVTKKKKVQHEEIDIAALVDQVPLLDNDGIQPIGKRTRSNGNEQHANETVVHLPVVKRLENGKYQIGRLKFIEVDGQFFHDRKNNDPAQGNNLTALRAYQIGIAMQVQDPVESTEDLTESYNQDSHEIAIEFGSQEHVYQPEQVPFLVVADPIRPDNFVKYDMPKFLKQLRDAINNVSTTSNSLEIVEIKSSKPLVTTQDIHAKLLHNVFFGPDNHLFMDVIYKHMQALAQHFKVSVESIYDASFVLPGLGINGAPVVIALAHEQVDDFEVNPLNLSYLSFFPQAGSQKTPVLNNIRALECSKVQSDIQEVLEQEADQFVQDNPDMTVGEFLFGLSHVACVTGVAVYQFTQYDPMNVIHAGAAFITSALVSQVFCTIHSITGTLSPIGMLKKAWASVRGQEVELEQK